MQNQNWPPRVLVLEWLFMYLFWACPFSYLSPTAHGLLNDNLSVPTCSLTEPVGLPWVLPLGHAPRSSLLHLPIQLHCKGWRCGRWQGAGLWATPLSEGGDQQARGGVDGERGRLCPCTRPVRAFSVSDLAGIRVHGPGSCSCSGAAAFVPSSPPPQPPWRHVPEE